MIGCLISKNNAQELQAPPNTWNKLPYVWSVVLAELGPFLAKFAYLDQESKKKNKESIH